MVLLALMTIEPDQEKRTNSNRYVLQSAEATLCYTVAAAQQIF